LATKLRDKDEELRGKAKLLDVSFYPREDGLFAVGAVDVELVE